jgi:hypothetical protein
VLPRAPRLFGRDRDLAIVRAAIDEGSSSIVGEAGVGKSELAMHLAATSEREVVWVDVSRAWDGDDARATIARALGIPLRTRDAEEGRAAIARAAAARGDLLFVVDGAEVCLPEVVAFSQLCRTLVVSRAKVDGAHVLEPLAPEHALSMFLACAGLEPSREERALLRLVLSHTGGHPATIELLSAAGSLRALDGVLERDSFSSIVEWAIERLPIDAREALARAAIFERPFRFEGFERVSRGASADVLARLADARLVRVTSRSVSIDRMVRSIALSSLDDEQHRELLALHAAFTAEQALAALRAFEGEEPSPEIDPRELEAAHLTALTGPASADATCALALALVLPDPSRASIFDLDRLDATIGMADKAPLAGRVRIARAALARSLGRPSEAAQGFSTLRALARDTGEGLLEARARTAPR